MKRILILGSTGSIGVQALEVIAGSPELEVAGLACGTRADLLASQAAACGGVPTACAAGGGTVPHDPDLADLIDATRPDMVLNALVGAAGLRPTLAAAERGIDVALANKESLVAGGDLVRAACGRTGARLLPVDSEHSALFQLLEGIPAEHVAGAVLTASGGPFRGMDRARLEDVRPADALRHPTWEMGAKITVDSATLMNKGLEVIEAHHLFDLPYERIEVVVHPQSLVHAMVRTRDGGVLAHCGPADMRVPIGHALCHPAPPPPRPPMDLVGCALEFAAPDHEAFPCLPLARAAGLAGGTAPAVLNAANEVAVEAFLAGRLPFPGIAEAVEAALDAVEAGPADTLEAVLDADARARALTRRRLAEVPA